MPEDESTGTPNPRAVLVYVMEHKEAVAIGLAVLATVVAISYAAELRRQMNSPAMQKVRTPCNCADATTQNVVPEEFFAGLDKDVYNNGDIGLREATTAYRGPDAGGDSPTG